jgi:hypothetical protein
MPTKPTLISSFSGGRTSGYMTKLLLDRYGPTHNVVVTFANTGQEDFRTLDFVHNCDLHFGFNTVWLEAVVHHGEKVSCSHNIVNYETADRSGRVFEEVIKKYGIPNVAFPYCTRELKLNPMRSYLRSLGISPLKTPTAVGIRADERRRVSKSEGMAHVLYPLVDEWPTDKQDVLDWWEDQPFDLGIEEFEGNCKGCFKKSLAKHFQQLDHDPYVYDWHERMEQQYRHVGPNTGDRVFFRGNLSVHRLFDLREEHLFDGMPTPVDIYANGGCSESCEVLLADETSDEGRYKVG